MIDKRMPLCDFKMELEMLLNVPSEYFLVYKRNTTTATSSFGASEREWVLPNETLEALGDDPQVIRFDSFYFYVECRLVCCKLLQWSLVAR